MPYVFSEVFSLIYIWTYFICLNVLFHSLFVVSCSCWLNPHGYFIQTFIVPVVLVILANIGFFIMALVIMNRHAKKQTHKNRIQKTKYGGTFMPFA